MPEDIIVHAQENYPGEVIEQELKETQRFYQARRADNTKRAYQSDISHFLVPEAGCGSACENDPEGQKALPNILAVNFSSLATSGKKTATITRKKGSLNHFYETLEIVSPAREIQVKHTLKVKRHQTRNRDRPGKGGSSYR